MRNIFKLTFILTVTFISQVMGSESTPLPAHPGMSLSQLGVGSVISIGGSYPLVIAANVRSMTFSHRTETNWRAGNAHDVHFTDCTLYARDTATVARVIPVGTEMRIVLSNYDNKAGLSQLIVSAGKKLLAFICEDTSHSRWKSSAYLPDDRGSTPITIGEFVELFKSKRIALNVSVSADQQY